MTRSPRMRRAWSSMAATALPRPTGYVSVVLSKPKDAPRVLIANSNLVPKWADWECFNQLDRAGLMMYGQMTAGSWIYIGTQGIVQGTYETFVEMGRQHYGGDLSGRWLRTAGLGGMGGAQPLAAGVAGAFFRPDLLTDQTSAHDPVNGYLPKGWSLERWAAMREQAPDQVEEAARASMAEHVRAMLAFRAAGVPTVDYGNN